MIDPRQDPFKIQVENVSPCTAQNTIDQFHTALPSHCRDNFSYDNHCKHSFCLGQEPLIELTGLSTNPVKMSKGLRQWSSCWGVCTAWPERGSVPSTCTDSTGHETYFKPAYCTKFLSCGVSSMSKSWSIINQGFNWDKYKLCSTDYWIQKWFTPQPNLSPLGFNE